MKKIFPLLLAVLLAVIGGGTAMAEAGDAASVTAVATSAGAILNLIYPIVLGAVGFGIFISLVKMVKRK